MTRGTLERRTVKHFTHIHPLTEVNGVGQFKCNGCEMYGSGKTFRCDDCDFDLDEFCATCPSKLPTSFMHPHHELNRVDDRPTPDDGRYCDVCRTYVQGIYYRCELCNFDAHPLCTQPRPYCASPVAATGSETLGATNQRSLVTQPQYISAPGSPYGYGLMGPYGPYNHSGGHHHPNPSSGPVQGQGQHRTRGTTTVLGVAALGVAQLMASSALGQLWDSLG